MKRIITYMAAMTALVLAFSCSRETMQDTRTGDGISLQVMWNEIATRADGDETEVNNEYAVNSLDWYFYKDTTAAPAFHYREAISGSDVKAQKYIRDFVPGTEYGGVAFPHRADLCGADDYCTVFVVANLPSDKVNATATLATLKAIEVNETFLDGDSPLAPDAEALNFIMTGQAQVKGTSLAVDKATAEVIELNRLAAKITYTVKVMKSKSNIVDGVTETWTPMLNGNNVRMYPQNVVKNAVLGAVDELYPTTLDTGDAETVVVSSSDNKWNTSDANYYVTKDALGPYYTYPYNWKDGGADTFVKIIVPWQVTRVQNGNVIYSAQREVYYKVMLPDPMTLSNTWYQLEITLAPGTENEPEVTVTAEYRVADWMGGGEEGVDGVLKDIKYLIADRSDEIPETGQEHGHFVTYTRGISIPYSASNPVIFKVIEASYTDFSTETPSEKKFVTTNAAGVTTYTNPNSGNNNQKHLGTYNPDHQTGDGWSMVQNLATITNWFHFDNGANVGDAEGHLILDHWLNADLTSIYFDASPYTFTVRIYLERDPDHYVEELKIIQYPQTYIEAQESHVKSGTASANSQFSGYIFINGISEVTNAGYNSPWTTIMSIGSNYSGRTNHNMYILTTGVLSDDTKRLGDPREEASYNAPKATGATVTFTLAPPVGGGANRSMTNYHPTDAAKSATFIAPKLRISSAFGRRGSNSNHNSEYNAAYNMGEDNANYNYASAWNRCASYQEDGYPAGRWRLPTEAEILYINTLSAKGYIPGMFNGPTPYWTASPGRAVRRVSTNPDVVRIDSGYTQASTRCVYDDWYWGSAPADGAQNTFMWGD